jgi:uncharacterized protein YmfQ (DUF2313 family)
MSQAPDLQPEDFAQAFADLLPVGPAWPRDPESVLMRISAALADNASDAHAAAQDLILEESDPARAISLLSDWERAYGLPDVCTPPAAAVQQRRAALLARIAATGGQSRAYYQAVAAALGYDVTIREFQRFVAGSRAGDLLNDDAWSLTWRVEAPTETVRYFRAGLSFAGEPLAVWGNTSLECVFNAIKPAHTILQFAYGSN